MATCKSCGALIDWVEMDTGSSMPIDREPRPTWCPLPGQLVVLKVYGKPAIVVQVPTDEPLAKVGVSHFATCPHADRHRRKPK
jgi:hypothetical protein